MPLSIDADLLRGGMTVLVGLDLIILIPMPQAQIG